MGKRTPHYTEEFKSEAVKLYRESGKLLSEIARDIGIATSTLSKWTRQWDIDNGKGPKGVLGQYVDVIEWHEDEKDRRAGTVKIMLFEHAYPPNGEDSGGIEGSRKKISAPLVNNGALSGNDWLPSRYTQRTICTRVLPLEYQYVMSQKRDGF